MPPTNPPAPPAAGKRGRKPNAEPKVYNLEGLSADFLSAPQEVPAALASLTAPMRARDERQAAMDRIVSEKYNEWVKAGKPTKWPLMPKARYHVPPEAVEGLQMLVRRAADFLGYSIKWGSPARDTEGRQIVVFAVKSRRESKQDTNGDGGSTGTSETAAAQEDRDPNVTAAERAEGAGGEGLAP